MAGLWEAWRDPANGDTLESCTLVTTSPVQSIAHIHDRMPVIVPPGAYAEWLDPGNGDADRLDRLLTPAASLQLAARPVSRLVNNARNQGPSLIERVDDEPIAAAPDTPTGPGDGQGHLPF
jgi:putative SOS response-associated peptidase YedK